MDTLIDSTFLPLLLKGAGFLMLVMLLWPIARRQSAALHSIYWRSAMLGLLVLGIFSLWVPILTFEWARSDAGVEAQPVSELVPLTTESPSGEWRVLEAAGERSPGGGAVTGSPATAAAGRRLVNPLLALWSAGSLLLSVRWIVARVRLSRLCASEPQGSHWAKLIGECQLAVGMRGRVRVAIDHKVAMPCAWGILRPTLMLPAGAERWDAGRQRMVLMHELSHLKRHDPLHDGIARLCVTLFWMNP
ncbi:MAG: M56 family metallopeptidase, partial [Verrucomicrobiales bacterium]